MPSYDSSDGISVVNLKALNILGAKAYKPVSTMSVFNLLLHGKWNYTKLNLHVYLTLEAVRSGGPGGAMGGG